MTGDPFFILYLIYLIPGGFNKEGFIKTRAGVSNNSLVIRLAILGLVVSNTLDSVILYSTSQVGNTGIWKSLVHVMSKYHAAPKEEAQRSKGLYSH